MPLRGMPPGLAGLFREETALYEAFLEKIYCGKKPRPRREVVHQELQRPAPGRAKVESLTPAQRQPQEEPACATTSSFGKAKFVAIVGPFIPVRERPEVASRMLGAVRLGDRVVFEDLQDGAAVTVQDLVLGRYLRCCCLRGDGSRGLSGWVIVHTQRGLHFMPCPDDDRPVTEEIEARFRAEAEAVMAKSSSAREQHLNSCPRQECSALPPLPGVKHLLLSAGCGSAQPRRRRNVLVAYLSWGSSNSCPIPIMRWLHKHFEVKTARMAREALAQLLLGKGSIDDDTLLVVVVHEPRAWSWSAASIGDWGFFQPLRRCEGEGQPERYASVENDRERFSLDCLLRTPLLCQGVIYPEGLAGVWASFTHTVLGAAAAAGASAAVVRQEDFLFQAADVAHALERLGLDRRGWRSGDKGEQDDGALDPLLCCHGWSADERAGDGLEMGQAHLLEALRGYAGLLDLEVGHAVSIDGSTESLRAMLGYTGYGNGRWGADGEAARWAALARERLGMLDLGKRMSALSSISNPAAVTCSCESVLSGATDLAALLRRYGVAWVRGAFEPARLRAVHESFVGIVDGPLGEELSYGNLRNNRRNTHLPFQPPFDGLELLGADGAFAPALLELLGDGFLLESATVITTPAHTESQQVHKDMPCEGGIVVHVPLHPITERFGPLFACGGTQDVTQMEAQQIAEQLGANYTYPSEEFEAAFRRRLCDLQHPSSQLIVGAPIDVGDAILYDARTWHGGLANQEEVPRHALYIDFGMAHVSRAYSITNQEGGVDEVRKALLAFRQRTRELLADSPSAPN